MHGFRARVAFVRRELRKAAKYELDAGSTFKHLGLSTYSIKQMATTAAAATSSNRISILDPPADVRGMKILDRQRFDKRVTLPCVRVSATNHLSDSSIIERVLKSVKKFVLKIDNLKPVFDDDDHNLSTSSSADAVKSDRRIGSADKLILLDPNAIRARDDDLDASVRLNLERCGSMDGIEFRDVDLTYANFKSEQVLNAVLPDGVDRTTSYSRVGHIVHVNLREHLHEYRHLIGEVLLDKLKGVRCVVNKTDSIDTEFRNFKMEVLASRDKGSDDDRLSDAVVSVRENGCQYEFDFGRVFWNPRLSSEHERLVELLPDVGHAVVLYDVFAGVGPFAVPAARRRRCRVLANDLNPDSFRWLQHNVKLNKVTDKVTCYNLDGRAFIRDVVAEDVWQCWTGSSPHYPRDDDDDEDHGHGHGHRQNPIVPEMHVAMNLPALAVEFLDAFRGAFRSEQRQSQLLRWGEKKIETFPPITVHCYSFVRTTADATERDELVVDGIRKALGGGAPLPDTSTTRITFVRKVAPNKDMVRATFRLPPNVLVDDKDDDDRNGNDTVGRSEEDRVNKNIVVDEDGRQPDRKKSRFECSNDDVEN